MHPPLTERRPSFSSPQEALPLPPVPGAAGYTQFLNRFPKMSAAQEEAAFTAYQQKKPVASLRDHALFAPVLAREAHAEHPPERQFTELFAASPSIPFLISFSHSNQVIYWARRYGRRYPSLDVEEFYSDALFRIIPDLVATHRREVGSFSGFVAGSLIKDLEDKGAQLIRRGSILPSGSGEGMVAPKRQTRRIAIERIDRLVRNENKDDPEAREHAVADPEAAEFPDSFARVDAIHQVFRLAGLGEEQKETVIALLINEEPAAQVGKRLGVGERALRYRREKAVEKLQALGERTIRAILNGEQPS